MKDKCKLNSLGFGVSVLLVFLLKLQQESIMQWKESSRKNRSQFILMKQWIDIKQENKKLKDFFVKNNYQHIAIYGMGDIGVALVKELENSEIEIAYGIDRNAKTIRSNIKLLSMEDNFTEVDAVIVTIIKDFDLIYEKLIKKLNCPILPIEDVINGI